LARGKFVATGNPLYLVKSYTDIPKTFGTVHINSPVQ
jgi:hypothetical protein